MRITDDIQEGFASTPTKSNNSIKTNWKANSATSAKRHPRIPKEIDIREPRFTF